MSSVQGCLIGMNTGCQKKGPGPAHAPGPVPPLVETECTFNRLFVFLLWVRPPGSPTIQNNQFYWESGE